MIQKSVKQALTMSLGFGAFDEITGTENGRWFCVKAVGGDATLSATSVAGDNLSSVSLQNGDYIYGLFSTIAVTSGTVLAYRDS